MESSGAEAGEEFQEIKRRSKDTYRKLILKGGRIVGAILVGDTQKAGIIGVLLKKKVEIGEFGPLLMSHGLNFMEVLPLIRRYGDKFSEPEYKEYLSTLKKWYQEGLIDPDFATVDQKVHDSKIGSNIAGTWWNGLGTGMGNYIAALKSPDKDAGVAYPTLKKGDKAYTYSAGDVYAGSGAAITTIYIGPKL